MNQSEWFFLSINFFAHQHKNARYLSRENLEDLEERKTFGVVIDCSAISYIDSSGVESLIELVNEMKNVHIEVFLASCQTDVIIMLERSDFFEKVSHPHIYPSVHDAVVQATNIFTASP